MFVQFMPSPNAMQLPHKPSFRVPRLVKARSNDFTYQQLSHSLLPLKSNDPHLQQQREAVSISIPNNTPAPFCGAIPYTQS